jgi:hypothetical protein
MTPTTESTVIHSASVEGRVVFMRSDKESQACVCCPPGTGHIFSRHLELQPFVSHYQGQEVQDFVRTEALNKSFEGKRVRVTVEVLED